MKRIDWANVLEEALGALISSSILALVAYLYSVISGQSRASSWLWIGLGMLVISIVAAFAWRSFGGLLSRLGQWAIRNRQLVAGLALLSGITYGNLVLTGSLWSVALTPGLALATILLIRSLYLIPQRQNDNRIFQFVSLPVGRVANASLEGKYLNPPRGEVSFGRVKFLLQPGTSVFDTTAARYIDSDGRVRVRVELPKQVKRVKSVHLLINAGGAFKINPQSRQSFEWSKIGEIMLGFEDETSQGTDLILGDNVREWAIGNFSGQLIDRVSDPLSQVAWKGRNTDGNYAVIDRLEIPILEPNKDKALQFIGLVREIPWHASAEEGGLLHFFVSAITLELEQ